MKHYGNKKACKCNDVLMKQNADNNEYWW
jgi:hypothetical protein